MSEKARDREKKLTRREREGEQEKGGKPSYFSAESPGKAGERESVGGDR